MFAYRSRVGCVAAGLMTVLAASDVFSTQASINVTEFHNHQSRDGLYIDAAFTQSAAAQLKRDTGFSGAISGNVFAQPLYLEDGPNGQPMVIVVTEANNIYALNAINGSIIWQRNVGTPVPLSSLPCGNINPLGITGTPVIDLSARTIFFDAMTTPDGGTTKRHLIYALNADTGTTNAGWPVDVNASANFNGKVFTSVSQNQRSALGLVNGIVYVTYGGHAGDCNTYYGWIVGVPMNNPASVSAWATTAPGGGSWGVGGVASDGINPFIATGNTFGATTWSGGEAIIRFQSGAIFSGLTNDYWAPTNWLTLDNQDLDLGGSGPILVDVPGATPSALLVALGKDGNAYLLNRANLSGIGPPLAQAHVSSTAISQAAATYRTAQGTYVVFCGNSSQSQLTALRITPGNPPTMTTAWTKSENGRSSPFVTSPDGINNVVVWGFGGENDQRLHGFDGDTGNIVYAGGGSDELMAGTRHFNTGIAARGRIYVATDNKVYAFTVPAVGITSTILQGNNLVSSGTGGVAGATFYVLSSTNIASPLTNWQSVSTGTFGAGGAFTITNPVGSNQPAEFFRVRKP